MRLPEIIGVSGPNGSGKDTLAALRAKSENAMHASLSDILRERLTARGVPHERNIMANLSRQLREDANDNGILVVETVERYRKINDALAQRALETYSGLSVVSLRHPEEARRIQKYGGYVIWVDSDPEIAYDRIQKANRGRVDDEKTLEEFIEERNRELYPDGDMSSGTVNMGAIKEIANATIWNNFDTEEKYIDDLCDRYEIANPRYTKTTG